MDRLYIPLIILHLSIVAKNCKDHTITEFGIIDSKDSSNAYVILYELTDTWFMDSKRRVGVWSLPWRWHILSIPLTTGRGTRAETCGLDYVFPPDDLCSHPEALCWYIYIYIYIYIYMQFNTRMLVTFGICFKQHFDTRYLAFYNPSPPRMFLSLD